MGCELPPILVPLVRLGSGVMGEPFFGPFLQFPGPQGTIFGFRTIISYTQLASILVNSGSLLDLI